MKTKCNCGRTLQFSKGFAHERNRRCDVWESQTPLDHADGLPAGFGRTWDRMSSNERDAWECSSKTVGEL